MSEQDNSYSGAMTLEKIQNGFHLRKNEAYNLKPPQINEVQIIQLSDTNEMIKSINEGNIDVAFGASIADLEIQKLPLNVKIEKTESLSTFNLYLNLNKSIFKNSEFRSDFKKLINFYHSQNSTKNNFLEKSNTFIPSGILSPSYYARTSEKITPQDFKKKWSVLAKNQIIELVFKKYSRSKRLKISIFS
jgi:hypothetical protein